MTVKEVIEQSAREMGATEKMIQESYLSMRLKCGESLNTEIGEAGAAKLKAAVKVFMMGFLFSEQFRDQVRTDVDQIVRDVAQSN